MIDIRRIQLEVNTRINQLNEITDVIRQEKVGYAISNGSGYTDGGLETGGHRLGSFAGMRIWHWEWE
ncbi:hypothetical protein Tco_0875653 [Tanacetum coccineum]|uniref:Uncharacterized protein n=1 Tax=Tanacetum coccineum TaxID=301880 RepID=A0ABQ5BSY0_9ASTR